MISLFDGQGEIIFDRPDEDVGAETASRYFFQYQCAARYCVEMLRDFSVSWLLCEWHTDYIVGRQDGTRILVSVKHREPDLGQWTIARMFQDGGLPRLLTRWRSSGRTHQCRWTTNGGLDGTKRNARELATACRTNDQKKILSFAEELWPQLAAESVEEAREFFQCLRIESRLPDRIHIRDHNVANYMKPTMTALGKDLDFLWHAYDAIVDVVAEAMRGCDGREDNGDWILSDPTALDESTAITQSRKTRTIDRQRVLDRLARVPEQRTEPLLLPSRSPSQHTTRLVKKLERGGVEMSMVNAARRLRRSWQTLEAQYSSGLPGPEEIDDIRTRVHYIAAKAATSARVPGEQYGARMLALIEQDVTIENLGRSPRIPIDNRHLLGLVYQLTDECEIWWSPPFKIETESESQ